MCVFLSFVVVFWGGFNFGWVFCLFLCFVLIFFFVGLGFIVLVWGFFLITILINFFSLWCLTL